MSVNNWLHCYKGNEYISYLLSDATNDKTMQEFLKPDTLVSGEDNVKTLVDDHESKKKCLKESITLAADDTAVPINQTSTMNDRLFEGNALVEYV